MKSLLLIIFSLLITMNIYCQSKWVQTNGPFGGNIVKVGSDSKGKLFALTEDRVLYYSTNKGESWLYWINNVTTFSFDNEDNIYIAEFGTGITIYDDNLNFKNILKKFNYESWKTLLQIIITNNGYIFINIDWEPLLLSTDNGTTWKQIYNDPHHNICVDSNNVIIMTFRSGTVRRSNDLGNSWELINIDSTFNNKIFNIAYDKKSNRFFSSGTGTQNYYTTDSGLTWLKCLDSIPEVYIRDMTIDNNGYVYLGGNFYSCYSTNSGETWKKMEGISEQNVNSIFCSNNKICTGNWHSGVTVSENNGVTTEEINTGIIKRIVNCIRTNDKGYLFVASRTKIFRSTDKGNIWEQVDLKFGNNIQYHSILSSQKGILYACSDSGIIKSTDDGITWTKSNINVSIQTLVESKNGTIYAGGNRLYATTDDGETWLEKTPNSIGTIESITTFDDRYIAFGTHTDGVYLTTDTCATWRQLSVNVVENYGSKVTFDQSGNLFIIMSAWNSNNVTWRSLDYGNTFEHIGIPSDILGFLESNNNKLFAGAGSRIYVSYDIGTSWRQIGDGLQGVSVSSICFGKNNDAYLGTFGNGVFKTDKLIGIKEEYNDLKSQLEIQPNPVNSNFKVNYNLESSSNVSINLFNALGQNIHQFENNIFRMEGVHELNFNAEDLPEGIYYILLTTDNRFSSEKLIIIH